MQALSHCNFTLTLTLYQTQPGIGKRNPEGYFLPDQILCFSDICDKKMTSKCIICLKSMPRPLHDISFYTYAPQTSLSYIVIIIHSASADASADLSADMPDDRFIKLKILLKHSRIL